jgi:outer membrane lipoprotein-sorting protein
MKTLFSFFAALLCLHGFSLAKEPTGEQIIQKVNDNLNVEGSHSISQMTILTTSGKSRTFVFESWSTGNGEKALMRYMEPSRVKGQATLMLNNADDIWMYFPRTQRVRKLATHAKKQKMEGSDFSYEDMGSGEAFINDFVAKRLDDEEMQGYDCYKLELTRKPDGDVSYSRLIMWVIKENNYPIVIDYYDEDDPQRLEKRLTQSDIKIIDGIPTAHKAVMHNKNDNTQTEMEMLEISYKVDVPDDMFTERSLKK